MATNLTNYLLLGILLSLTLPFLWNVAYYSDRLRQKRHIKRKIDESYYKMWELTWALEKTKNMREGFRVEYDRLQEELSAYPVRIERLKERNVEGDDKQIEETNKVVAERTKYSEILKQRLQWADGQISGFDENEEHHEGFIEAIDGYRELIKQLKAFKKNV